MYVHFPLYNVVMSQPNSHASKHNPWQWTMVTLPSLEKHSRPILSRSKEPSYTGQRRTHLPYAGRGKADDLVPHGAPSPPLPHLCVLWFQLP